MIVQVCDPCRRDSERVLSPRSQDGTCERCGTIADLFVVEPSLGERVAAAVVAAAACASCGARRNLFMTTCRACGVAVCTHHDHCYPQHMERAHGIDRAMHWRQPETFYAAPAFIWISLHARELIPRPMAQTTYDAYTVLAIAEWLRERAVFAVRAAGIAARDGFERTKQEREERARTLAELATEIEDSFHPDAHARVGLWERPDIEGARALLGAAKKAMR